jgi:branched-chain amino acid transport system permease protein
MTALARRVLHGSGGVGLSRAAWLLAIAGLALLPLTGSSPLIIQATSVLIFVLLAVSLNLVVGYAGMISMGHGSFFALGGYGAAICAKHLGLGMTLSFIVGPLVAASAALVIGLFCIRLTQAYFIMLTLAFAQLVYTGIWKWTHVTGGDDGLIGFGPPAFLADEAAYFYFTATIVLGSLYVLYKITRSPFGLALTAIRDNPSRTAAVGVNVQAVRLAAFVIAGFFGGIAGALQAFFQRGMFIESAHFITSADALVVAVLGGTRTFVGPIVGAILFKVLGFLIPTITVYWPFFLGVIIILIALYMPNGIMSSAWLRAGGRSQ